MTLHLAAVILFQKFTQNIIHIPGKCVPQILVFLKDHLDGDNYVELVKLQGELCFSTLKILNIRTLEKFAVITLKFEQGGFTIE